MLLWVLSLFLPLDRMTWDDKLVDGLTFIEEHVLQVPFFLMSLMRYVTPALDDLFMASLNWVDRTNAAKHGSARPTVLFYPTLRLYRTTDRRPDSPGALEKGVHSMMRFAIRALVSLAVFAASFLPIVGRLVLPTASFWTFNRAVGPGPACVVFGVGLLLPRRYLVVFLQSYYASRALVRELLEPYFTRIPFTREEKRKWFRSREGLLFGFGISFYILLKIPLLGVLIYGIAEAVSSGRLLGRRGWKRGILKVRLTCESAEHGVSHHQDFGSAAAAVRE